MSFVPKIHKNGPDELVIESGGTLTIKSGGAIAAESGSSIASPDPGTHIPDLTAITGGEAPTEAEHNLVVEAINDILAILVANNMMLPGS